MILLLPVVRLLLLLAQVVASLSAMLPSALWVLVLPRKLVLVVIETGIGTVTMVVAVVALTLAMDAIRHPLAVAAAVAIAVAVSARKASSA